MDAKQSHLLHEPPEQTLRPMSRLPCTIGRHYTGSVGRVCAGFLDVRPFLHSFLYDNILEFGLHLCSGLRNDGGKNMCKECTTSWKS